MSMDGKKKRKEGISPFLAVWLENRTDWLCEAGYRLYKNDTLHVLRIGKCNEFSEDMMCSILTFVPIIVAITIALTCL